VLNTKSPQSQTAKSDSGQVTKKKRSQRLKANVQSVARQLSHKRPAVHATG